MTIKSIFSIVLLFTLQFLFSSAYAHHSTSHYSDQISEIEGTLVEVRWRNPHVYFFLEAENEDGSKTVWELEAGTLYNITRAGITSDLFNVGDKVRVAGNKSQTYDDKFWLENILATNGNEYIFVARSAPRWNDTALGGRSSWTNEAKTAEQNSATDAGIFRVWSPTVRGTQLSDGLTANRLSDVATQEAMSGRSGWDYSFDRNCEAPGMPRANHSAHPHQFIDKGDTMEIFSEEFHGTRVIHMVDHADPESQPYSALGYSTGQWADDNTLVIETSRINFPVMDLTGIKQSDQVSVVETYVFNDDQSQVEFTVVVNDPIMLKEAHIKRGLWLDLNEVIDLDTVCIPESEAV